MSLLYPYCEDCSGDGTSVQHRTDAAGQVPDGQGGLTAALDIDGAPIGPNALIISFYDPDGAYVNSWAG